MIIYALAILLSIVLIWLANYYFDKKMELVFG